MPMLLADAVAGTTIPTALTTAFEFMVNGAVSMISIVTGNAVLCLGVAMWCAGGAIGLFKRLV